MRVAKFKNNPRFTGIEGEMANKVVLSQPGRALKKFWVFFLGQDERSSKYVQERKGIAYYSRTIKVIQDKVKVKSSGT